MRGPQTARRLIRLAVPFIAVSCGSRPTTKATARQNLSPDLEPFLRSYFATWSAGDMRAYKEHFHRDAVIAFVEEGEVKSSLPRDRFVALQAAARLREGYVRPSPPKLQRRRAARARPSTNSGRARREHVERPAPSGEQMVERMTSFTADEDEHAATVVAQWELTIGEGSQRKVKRGVDRFTLMRDERGRWRIVSLIFYLTGQDHNAALATEITGVSSRFPPRCSLCSRWLILASSCWTACSGHTSGARPQSASRAVPLT